jgi:5-oxoprolinase (ATP-hydrolysing) subunit A
VPRSEAGAVHHELDVVVEQALSMARHQRVTAIDGTELHLPIRSLCVHGDTPGAVESARAVRAALDAAGLTLQAFA